MTNENKKKKCSKCGIESSKYLDADKFEHEDGKDYCVYCYDRIHNNENEVDKSKTTSNPHVNIYHEFLNLAAIVVLVLGIVPIILMFKDDYIIQGFIFLLALLILFLILKGLAEIIRIVHEINNKL